MAELTIGKNSVLQLLINGSKINQILINRASKNDERVNEIINFAQSLNVPYRFVDQKDLDSRCRNAKHQGVVAYTPKKEYVEIEDILEYAQSKGEQPFLVILDGIEDPHNFGSIIRSAVGAGVHGIIIPKMKQVEITPVVTKVSTGAVDNILISKVSNLAQTVDSLKQQGVWIFGCSMEGAQSYSQQDFKTPLAIVIGNEGKGINKLLKQKCDFMISIPTEPCLESLNAGVSAGIIFFKVREQRGL